MPLTNIYYNTLIDYNIVICYNCGKNGYFILSCLKLKNINNIKEIEEEEIFNELGKEKP